MGRSEAALLAATMMKQMLAQLKFFAVTSFYLGCNFMPMILLLAVYKVFTGSMVGMAILCVCAVDLAIPMKFPGLNTTWCTWTDESEGKSAYFPAETAIETDFKKDKNYLVCYHPHSLYGVCYNLYASALHHDHGFKPLFTGADVVLYIPILRRMLCAWGVTPVSAKSMKKHLQLPYPHNILTLLPGGIGEMFFGLSHEQIILKKRKGFVRIALQTGASLVPCYALGANQAWTRHFDQNSLLYRISSQLRVSLVVWTGRWGIPFGFIPHKQRLVVALGPAIEVMKVEEPTQEQVDELHTTYCKELRALFDRHKHKLGWENEELHFEDEDLLTHAKR